MKSYKDKYHYDAFFQHGLKQLIKNRKQQKAIKQLNKDK